jgi:hypothetical protein
MNLQNPRRSELTGVPFLNNALDLILTSINALWGVEHNADGTHGALTADSLTVSGNTVSGATEMGVIPTGNDPTATGITLGEQWRVVEANEITPGSGVGRELQFWDLVNGGVAPALRLVWVSDHWVLFHGQGQTSGLHLGTNSRRIDEAHILTAYVITALRSSTGLLSYGRSVAEGEWQAVAFSAGNYTASAGTWTVAAGDVVTHRYMLIGKTMWLSFAFQTTDVSNAGVTLRLTLPGGATAAATTYSAIRAIDNGAAEVSSVAVAPVGQTYLEMYATAAAGTFAIAAGTTTVSGMAVIEIT